MHGKIKVYSIWRDPVRYGIFARQVKGNILRIGERTALLHKLRKEHPGVKFYWFVDWKTPAQLKVQLAFAKAMKSIKKG